MSKQQEIPLVDRTSVELFAGGGGLAMGVHRAGLRPLLFNEFDKRSCETLLASPTRTLADSGVIRVEDAAPSVPAYGEPVPLYGGDIRDLDMSAFEGQVDVLAGGPPCQPFSLGGVARGDEDERNMFPQMFRAVRDMKPKVVICENVRGLLRPSFAPYFEYIKRELELPFLERVREHEAAGPDERWLDHDERLIAEIEWRTKDDRSSDRYRVAQISVNAADYGVPQIRQRVVLVAFRADLGVDVEAFEADLNRARCSEDSLNLSILEGTYWDFHADVPAGVREWVMERVKTRVDKQGGEDRLRARVRAEGGLPPWLTLRDAVAGYAYDVERLVSDPGGVEKERLNVSLPDIDLEKLDKKTQQGPDGVDDHVGWPGARIYKGHTPNELDRPAKTVKAGVHGVPGGESVMLIDESVDAGDAETGYPYKHRYMTVRETARVMTFPDTWRGEGPRGEKMRQLGNAVPMALGEFIARKVTKALDDVNH